MRFGRIGFLLASIILAAALSTCSTGGTTPASENGEPSASGDGILKPVTLKIMFPGDPPANWDEVKTEMENRLAGTLNVKLDVVFIPWSDVRQKRQVSLSSAEDYDLIWTTARCKISPPAYTSLWTNSSINTVLTLRPSARRS